jgi:hypothetical protein
VCMCDAHMTLEQKTSSTPRTSGGMDGGMDLAVVDVAPPNAEAVSQPLLESLFPDEKRTLRSCSQVVVSVNTGSLNLYLWPSDTRTPAGQMPTQMEMSLEGVQILNSEKTLAFCGHHLFQKYVWTECAKWRVSKRKKLRAWGISCFDGQGKVWVTMQGKMHSMSGELRFDVDLGLFLIKQGWAQPITHRRRASCPAEFLGARPLTHLSSQAQ